MTQVQITSIEKTICKRLVRRPLKALRIFQNGITTATSPLVADRLSSRFGNTMELLVAATRIDTEEGLRKLPEIFSAARRSDQKRLLTAVVDKLASLGAVAKHDPQSAAAKALKRVGELVPSLVLEGTLQQQFFCKLATRLGFRRRVPLSKPVVHLVAVPMIDALKTVIRVGAETTRDSAIEGMGALLKLASGAGAGRPAERFVADAPIPEGIGDPKLNEIYAQRLTRRRLMVLAVADPEWATKLLEETETPIQTILDEVRAKGSIEEVGDEIETVLYKRSDLLRILPAIARQKETAETASFAKLLCAAARPVVPRPDDPPSILIAYARYQESVFRTIDTMIKRETPWREFDDVVAAAVHAIPWTMAGPPQVCNAQVRATISLIRTAVRVTYLAGKHSDTKEALRPLFSNLGEPLPWVNLGIAEGCFRALPELLSQEMHEDLYNPALSALFDSFSGAQMPLDFAAVHRRLIATSCFRRILISIADRAHERYLDRNVDEAVLDLSHVDEDLRLLLREPTVKNVIDIFQRQACAAPAAGGRCDIAVKVIAAIAHECDMLRNAVPLFAQWKDLPSYRKVLLTRILALQLHAVARDTVEVGRYPRLNRVFSGTPTVAMPAAEATDNVWQLLAALPSEAAEAADPDIQRFVEYRGRRMRTEPNVHEPVEDLPGYVLAMISPHVSNRIAGAIAREIDLNLCHDRDRNPNADFAEPLYQVMLRGPAKSIFDHLMPRLERDDDRRMVMLFRKHVAEVHDCAKRPPAEALLHLRAHVGGMIEDLTETESPTLAELRKALSLFHRLVSDDYFWDAIHERALTKLFEVLDALDERTHGGAGLRRVALTPRCGALLIGIEEDLKHYRELPIGNFGARSATLEKAVAAAESVARELAALEALQPPERVLLLAATQRLCDVLDRTNRWYCVEAQRHVAENDKDGFWMVFALDTDRWTKVAARLKSHVGSAAEIERVQHKEAEIADRLKKLEKRVGNEPPRFTGQSEQFEEFAVDWMSSDLDLEALGNALSHRWRPMHQRLFRCITTPLGAFGAVLVPFLFASAMHVSGMHRLEGLAFGVIAAGIVFVLLRALLRLIQVVRNTPTTSRRHGYVFRSMLPQMAGFIAAPMALVAKFEHSYEFPLHASVSALLLLLLVAFVATRFSLEREIADRQPSAPDLTPRERHKVAKIVGVAFVQAFAIAVLLTCIFANSHYRASDAYGTVPRAEHSSKYHDLFGIVPQDAFVDLTALTFPGREPWSLVREHGLFTFYPVTILTWTALGLFFGLVLEGIGKGEHLRGHAAKEKH